MSQQDVTTPVLRNTDLGHGNFLVEFACPELTSAMRPAQFFMIGIPGSETLLRRPYSVCGLHGTFDDAPAEAVQVLYRIVGRGTSLLASLKTGAPLTVLGPLGNGFEAPRASTARPVFVAGGIGSAPFPALARWLEGRCRPPFMYYGARTRGDLPLSDWFAEHTERLVLTTEDGSVGRRGLVTEPLAELLEREEPDSLHLYVCGPDPMLRAVASLARRHGVRCDLALEAHMACGFGVCLGCVVPTRGEGSDEIRYERVCVEGPVMEAGRLAW
jgi:dihydroorotate dehydrogenase electron transfer subunit